MPPNKCFLDLWPQAVLCASLVVFSAGCSTGNTAVRPSTRPDYTAEQRDRWMNRHLEFVARAKQGDVEVLFLGDSITDYWRDRGRVVWDREFAPLHAANFGISGDRTQQVLWRITHGELEGITPKVVVLMIGTNNTGPGLGESSLTPKNTPDEIVAGIRRIVRVLRSKLPQTHVLLFGIFPRGEKNDPLRPVVAEINRQLQSIHNGVNVTFIDISGDFLTREGDISKDVMPDLLHPTERGYETWAAALRRPLRQALGLRP